ncbi:MAG: sigma-70 family RNA polymerase sigma factor [Planctomycetes bacterium]|nr:sigma-70 family RNA polymerase sigma factor [Planctomycetota bacterium]
MGPEATCWTLIQGAARGMTEDIEEFIRLYAPVVRSYFSARWQASALRSEIEDAVQDVFVECFKEGGVLEHAGPLRVASFRGFLLGVARHVSLRAEARGHRHREVQAPSGFHPDEVGAEEPRLSLVFDRAWARALLREAVVRQAARARILGKDAERRVELLRLRFHEGKTLREIAAAWQAEHTTIRKQNARALQEFEEALREAVAFHHPGLPAAAEQEMASILASL